MKRVHVWAAVCCAALAGCEGGGAHPSIVVDAAANVRGVLFLDLNGNAQLDVADQPVKGWPVKLVGPNGGTVATAVSDSIGIFQFGEVPTGRVRIDVDRAGLADTLGVFGLSLGANFDLAEGDTTTVTVGFTYPTVALAAVDTLPVGRKVFVDGLALNAIGSTGPRELHLRSGAEALRVTNVVRRAVSPGDSVRVLGRRGVETGVAVLTGADIILVRSAVADPEPIELTTRDAGTARQGTVGADLGRIRNADLISSRNELSDVVLTVDDGTGPTEILIRSFLGADASFFNADSIRVREATGLLVPYQTAAGQLGWRLATRGTVDLRTEPERRGGN